jgi:hypothetical protein
MAMLPYNKRMKEETFPLQVICNQKETVGSCRYDRFTRKEAIFQGIKMWLLAMLVAGLTILIPLVHFISVPVGLLLSPLVGVYFFFARKGAPKRVIGNFSCPECHAENHVETERIYAHYFGHCAHCQHEYKMVPLPAGPET